MNKKTSVIVLIIVLVATGGVLYFKMRPRSGLPTLVYETESRGCGDFFVYKLNKNRAEGISVSADRAAKLVGVSTKPMTFDIASADGLKVEILVDSKGVSKFYCDDAIDASIKPARWVAKSGEATITASKDNLFRFFEARAPIEESYTVTVILKNVEFQEMDGARKIKLDELIFEDVLVGGIIG